MDLNLDELVEINDDPNRKTKKYMTKDGNVIYGPFLDFGSSDGEKCSKEEAAEILEYLDRCKEEDSQNCVTLEEAIAESVKYYSSIPMYDYGLGKMSNQQAMADFYGQAIVDHILEEQHNGRISTKLWQKIKDIRARKLPPEKRKYSDQCKHLRPQSEPDSIKINEFTETEPEPEKKEKPKIKIKKRERQKGDDYFLSLERGIIRNESYRQLFKGPSVVYEWLWANIVRDQWRDSKAYPIQEKYYDKGYLAYCSTYRQIAKDCFMSKNTVHGYIKQFKKAGIIKTWDFKPEGKKQGQTIFILGTWTKVNGVVVETYYRDTKLITPKPVKK